MGKFCQWVVCFCLVVMAGAQVGQLWLMRSMEESLMKMRSDLSDLSDLSELSKLSNLSKLSDLSDLSDNVSSISSAVYRVEEEMGKVSANTDSYAIAKQINELEEILGKLYFMLWKHL